MHRIGLISAVSAAWILTAAAGASAPATSPAGADERTEAGTRPLLGFEPAEIEKIAQPHVRKGKPQWRVRAGYPYDLGPNLTQAHASQGRQSICRSYLTGWAGASLTSGSKFQRSRPGVYRRAATLLRTSGWHHLCFGGDWSSHPRLWCDAKSTAAEASVALEIEDEHSARPVVRTYRLPKGKWVTLECDIEGAARARLLDRARIVSLYVVVRELAGRTAVCVDNIRLASAGAKPRLDRLKDSAPWPVPGGPPTAGGRATRPHRPRPVEADRDRSALPPDEKPRTIDGRRAAWGNSLHKVPRGIAAFDNRHLVSVFMAPTAGLRCSADGGRTWRGPDGKPCTVLAAGNNTPNRHGFFCSPTEVLALYITHCAGGGSPTETYFRRAAFDGARWTVGEVSVVDADVRHCPERYEVIRLPDGRLWAAWDHYDRRHRVRIIAKFSDDNGRTWQHGGNHGLLSDPVPLGGTPRLAACGDHEVVCLWRTGRGGGKKVLWSRFDRDAFEAMSAAYPKQPPAGRVGWERFAARSAWTTPEALPVGGALHSAVGMPDGRCFAAVGRPEAVLVRRGKTWAQSLAGRTGLLSRCGKVVLFFKDADGQGISYVALDSGRWTRPRSAARQERKIKSIAVPQVCPPNFAPLAWSLEGQAGTIRTLRVPIR